MQTFQNIKQKLTVGTKALCFTMILDAFLLKSCSGGPRRLWRSGSALGGSGGALGGPGRVLGGSIYKNSRSTAPAAVMLFVYVCIGNLSIMQVLARVLKMLGPYNYMCYDMFILGRRGGSFWMGVMPRGCPSADVPMLMFRSSIS